MHPFIHIDFLHLKIPLYGLALVISMTCGYLFARRQLVKQFHLPAIAVDVFLFLILLGSILGARLFFLVFESGAALQQIPFYLVNLRSSGVTFYGGYIVGFAVMMIFVRKYKINFWQLADLFTLPVIFGLGLTRIGCFMAGCCWGKPADVPWAVTFTSPEAITPYKHLAVHPVQLYHSLTNFTVFFILLIVYLTAASRPHGLIFALFLMLYPLGRFFTEFFRGDAARGILFDVLSTSQLISMFVFPAGMVTLLVIINQRLQFISRRKVI